MINPESHQNVVRHIEIKAYVDDYKSLCTRVANLAAQASPPDPSDPSDSADPFVDRVQNDTFFHCRSGRLKLRSSGQYHDLIYYRRDNDYGPSESFYQFARTRNPGALRTSLTSAFGEAGRVRKFRRTYRVGRSIIHLDKVSGLGDFVEIKAELGVRQPPFQNLPVQTLPVQKLPVHQQTTHTSCCAPSPLDPSTISVKEGAKIVKNLMTTLDIDLFQLVDGAYVDLLNEREQARSEHSRN